jgi:sulfur relay (sulfurtransferase) DsrF/TusC family protein
LHAHKSSKINIQIAKILITKNYYHKIFKHQLNMYTKLLVVCMMKYIEERGLNETNVILEFSPHTSYYINKFLKNIYNFNLNLFPKLMRDSEFFL